ncbi:AlbA family DNA-binding domain-containing protein [Nocardioides sp. GXQ0305]|uniref:AlbA family DNA-binding domain-containing protein n=1 Tax=Nocardioides sp. GXQ0305 TaxID=3423912 RepID=UPI003D7E4294
MDLLDSLAFRAAAGGAETTLAELVELRGIPPNRLLSGIGEVVDYFSSLGLELVPEPGTGELSTPRVLRRPTSAEERRTRAQVALEAGESQGVEFKESLYADMRRLRKTGVLAENADLPGESLKTIAAFMNGKGGELLIGVSDKHGISDGIERDFQAKSWDADKWQLQWEMLVDNRFLTPGGVRRFLEYDMLSISGKPIFHVSVRATPRPTFVKRRKDTSFEFFVRRGPSSVSLSLTEFAEHYGVSNSVG